MHVSEKEGRHNAETPYGAKLEGQVEDSGNPFSTPYISVTEGKRTCRALVFLELPLAVSVWTNRCPGHSRLNSPRQREVCKKHLDLRRRP
jgi:hypothetical protein